MKKSGTILKKAESIKLRKRLPSDAVTVIAGKINKSPRLVRYVLNGLCGDNHGIIDLSIQLAEMHEKFKTELAKALKN